MTTMKKAQIVSALRRLPDDCTIEDVQYELYLISKVRNGLAEIELGKGISHAEVHKRMKKWLEK